MITLTQFPHRQPVHVAGPYKRKRKVSRLELIADITGILAVGTILAISFLGMTGALS